MDIPALAISSSDIRRRVREAEPIRYLVPEAVHQYIAKFRLYRRID
jgi:nicotinate-nucleotide adenylyltransferase